jgi:hypothetical protein
MPEDVFNLEGPSYRWNACSQADTPGSFALAIQEDVQSLSIRFLLRHKGQGISHNRASFGDLYFGKETYAVVRTFILRKEKYAMTTLPPSTL